MSESTRAILGSADNLVETLPNWDGEGGERSGAELCYSLLLDMGETFLVGARRGPTAAEAGSESEGELLRLQGDLLLHYFRLQKAERTLSTRLGRRRPAAMRQIELERQRLARDLHTSVGQQLSAIRLQTDVIASQLGGANPVVQEALDRISTLTADALEQVRSISKFLHPPEWQRLTLETALQQLWDLSGIPQRFESSVSLATLSQEPELDAKVLLYRAAQEAVSNLVRHSRATRADLRLAEREGHVVLTFRDNGVGFDVGKVFTAPASVAGGIGLRSIREQADALGGELSVESGPNGTTLEVSVPLRRVDS